MPTPSLLIVPARFKTGKLYSQIPTSGAGDFTVTRNTAARRFDSAGLIESVASGIPRLDYYTSGGTAGCPALLVEPSAQNLALQSQDFTTTWSPTNVTVSANVTGTTDPFGTNLADLLTATASGSARVVQTFSFVSGTTYTYSCFAKAGNGFFGMTMENGGVASGVAVVWNVSTGAFSVSGSVGSGYTLQAHNIENYGNGWYRCSMRVLLGLTVTGNIRVNTSNGTMSSVVVQSDNGNNVNVFGAQIEAGSIATSYIPTTTGTGSRSADVVSVSGAVSGSIGQTEGTIYIEGVITNYADAAASFITISDNTINNRLEIRKGSPGSISFERESATQSASTSISATGQVNGIFKMAVAYKSGDTAFFINGIQVATTNAATFTMNTLTHIYLGSNASGTARRLNDRIRAAALYTTRLTNADLLLLTLPGNNTYLPQAVWDNYLSRPGNSEVPDCLYTRHADLLDV